MKFPTLAVMISSTLMQYGSTTGLKAREARTKEQDTRHLVGNINILPKTGQAHDLAGNTHERKRQTFNGIPVLGSDYIVHHTQNGLNKITGQLQEDFQVDTHPKIKEQDAIKIARSALDNSAILIDLNIELAIIHHKGRDRLVYKIEFDGSKSEDPSMPQVLVDAQSGEIISQQDNIKTFEAHHHHHHPNHIPHSSPDSHKPEKHDELSSDALMDEQKITYDWQTYTVGDSSDKILANLHTYSQDVIDFINQVMGINILDDFGRIVESFGHYGYQTVNAFYDGSAFFYGDGDNFTSTTLAVLDVVAHEIGHAVTHASSNLEYYGESGALSEGFSDVMAAAIEAWVDGNKTSFRVTENTWYLGEDAWLLEPALRYMMSPSLDGYSTDHYSEIYRGSDDNGGVHWNSGILNHFFYLLTMGGKHHNEKFHTSNYVDGIGMGEAYMIVSTANMFYFTSYSNYADAREATINACEDSFFNENICESVKKAWAEVGVGCAVDDQCKLGSSPCAIATCLEDGSCLYEGRDEHCNPCQDDEMHVGIDLYTDAYITETHWNITETFFRQVIHTGGQWPNHYQPNTEYTLDYCLPKTSCYEFSIYDDYGDGIASPGGYRVLVDGVEVGAGGGDSAPFKKETVEIPCENAPETFDVNLDFWFDYYPQEIWWYLTTEYFGNTIAIADAGNGYVKENALQHLSKNVTLFARACYDLYITDSHGDGMCCGYGQGNFTVKMDDETILSGSDFGYAQHVRVGACDERCSKDENLFHLSIDTDNFGSETHWSVTNSRGEVVLKTEGKYASNTENTIGFCLPKDDCFNFTITDDHGDGLCCYSGNGGYSVEWDGLVVAEGGEFGFYESVQFGGNCSAPLNMRRATSEQKMSETQSRELLFSEKKNYLLRGRNFREKDHYERNAASVAGTLRVVDSRRQYYH